jgi:Mce-associated membrane protein
MSAMADAKEPPEDSATSKADAMALLEEAEAEAAEAEALAAAARARARAARLRREALAAAEGEAEKKAEAEVAEGHGDAPAAEAADKKEAPAADAQAEEVEETAEYFDESDAEASGEAAEAAEPESRPARWRRRLPSLSVMWKVAAIILIICFAVASGYMAWQHREATEREQRAARFVAGARQGVVNMTSLNFTKAKEDVQRVIDSSTGEFRDDFQRSAKDFTTVVEKSKVVTEGTVNAAALESMDEHSASVLVSATSKITNAAGAKDEPRAWRLRVAVTEDGGQYKMSKVDFVP